MKFLFSVGEAGKYRYITAPMFGFTWALCSLLSPDVCLFFVSPVIVSVCKSLGFLRCTPGMW